MNIDWVPITVAQLCNATGIHKTVVIRTIIPLLSEGDDYVHVDGKHITLISREVGLAWIEYAKERKRRIESDEYPKWHSKRPWSLADFEDCTK